MLREAQTINRQLEFFSPSELTKQIGHPPERWPAVIVAELIDNALDHCEEIRLPPRIRIVVLDTSIEVFDNGDGMPSELIERMADFNSRTSSRIGLASPTRGAQGNAGKCLFALPFVLSGKSGLLEIDSLGILHHIHVSLEPLSRKPLVDIKKTEGEVPYGTRVTVHLPRITGDQIDQIVEVVENYALLNKHASFSLYSDVAGVSRESTSSINKWTAGDPVPAAWYDDPSFMTLLADRIHRDRTLGRKTTVLQFLRDFAGLKRHAAAKEVLERTKLTNCNLDQLANSEGIDSTLASQLLLAMKACSSPPKPSKLGFIGCEHIEEFFGCPVEYKRIQNFNEQELPFVVEAAFCEFPDNPGRLLVTGVNFAADIHSPRAEIILYLLSQFMVTDSCRVNVLVHVTTPRVQYTNRGKTEADFDDKISDAIEAALKDVTKKYTAKRKAEERDASYASKPPRSTSPSLNDAIRSVMEESISIVSQDGTCDFSARNHYYAIRPLVQRYTDRPLEQSYLDRVIDEWEEENGIIEGRTRDPRGFLLEPHTGIQIALGTREVENYEIPIDRYHTIIYVEKKGLLPNFKYGKIAERFDAAIICAEGYAVRAAQSLMQSAYSQGIQVFVFHDADPAGYGIANSIGVNSGAHEFAFNVIDAGLKLEEALDMGLPTEKFTRQKALPSNLCLTSRERKLFTGIQSSVIGRNGKTRYQWNGCERVELNALAAHPALFVKWVEQKLVAHGAAMKLIPEPSDIIAKFQEAHKSQREKLIMEAIVQRLPINSLAIEIDSRLPKPPTDGLVDNVRRWGKEMHPFSWDHVCTVNGEHVAMKEQADIQNLASELFAKHMGSQRPSFGG